VKGQMRNKNVKKMKPITIKVKNFYGEAWLNVIDLHNIDSIVLEKLHKTKADAEKEFPRWVSKVNKKIVKVWLVEAL